MPTAAPPQDYKNHQKFVPLFHFVALPILLINLIFSGFVAVTSFSVDSVIGLLVALALIVVALYAGSSLSVPRTVSFASRNNSAFLTCFRRNKGVPSTS